MTLSEVRDKADAKLVNLWVNQIRPKQLAYFATHGKYWQGLVTSSIPEDGADIVADYTSRPSDQAETWEDMFGGPLDANLPVALRVDVYEAPAGWGFVARVWIRYAGTVYTKSQNYGPETWRTQDWTEVKEGIL